MLKSCMKRWISDNHFIKSACFIETARGDLKNSFTRNRKLSLPNLVCSMLGRKGLSLKMELRNLIKKIKIPKISKVGYLKQRMKLNPEAIVALNEHHEENYYKFCEYLKKWNDFFVFAVDGSDINLPTTDETLTCYGNACGKNAKPKAQLGLSCLYDCLNRMIIDVSINAPNFNEREEAIKHIKKVNEFIKEKSIVTLDRGYPSTGLILSMLEIGQKFVVRLDSCTYKREQQSMKTNDEVVEIIFDQPRINAHRGKELANKMKEIGSIKLRFVRIKLSSGEYEYLLTNLDKKEISTEQMYELYGIRWCIETAYDDLKNKLQIENFTGVKPRLIEQDIYTTIYLLNLMNDIIQAAEYELDLKEKNYKHMMRINKNLSFGIIKEEIMTFILEKNDRKRKKLFLSIIEEIQENLLPVRKDRKYGRTKGNLVSKYSNTHKRSY